MLSSGQGSGLTNRTLGQTGGAETHTLSVSEMPAHTHTITATTTSDGSHTHSVTETSTGGHPGAESSLDSTSAAGFYHRIRTGGNRYDTILNTPNHTHSVVVNSTNSGHSHTISASAGSEGSGSAHNNMTPYYVLAFIIRYQ